MKLSHSLLAAALTSTLVLSACTGDDEGDGGTATSDAASATGAGTGDDAAGTGGDASGTTGDAAGSGDAAGATGDAASQTGDAAAQTGDAAGSTGAASSGAGESEDRGTLTIDEADAHAEELLTTAMESTQLDGNAAAKAREAAFAGAEFEAQQAAGLLEAVNGKPPEWDAEESPVDFSVLAISRSGERGPGLILAQTVPESGNPVLSLMASQEDRSEYRIVWQAPMLPGTSIGTFERRSAGAPKVWHDDGEGLTASPEKVLNDLANYLSFPIEGENPEIKTNGYAPEVRVQAQEQADDVSVQAEFSQSHELGDQQVHTLELEDGSAMTFAVLDRTSVFDVYDGMELTPPDSFWYFTRDRSITEEAEMNTSVFVALHIPEEGEPSLISAREQLVDASGS